MRNRVAVLTSVPHLPLYGELAAAGRKLGVEVEIWDANQLAAACPPALFTNQGAWEAQGVGRFLPRVGNFRPESVLSLVEVLWACGVEPLNRPQAIRRGRDHWQTARLLEQGGVPCPETVAGGDPETLAEAAASKCGFPCVVKTRRSRKGVGVVRCQSKAELQAVLDSLARLGEECVVQRFCPPGGVSFRILVLEGKPLGVARHVAREGEFRSNAARGAQVEGVPLTADMGQLAVAAAAALGLGFCGVDLLPDGERLVVGEVNPTPGWARFAPATGVEVARLVVEALARREA